MSRPAITAAAFALTAGAPSDARALLHVDPGPDPGGRRLLIAVEPLEPSARGFELAALALAALRDGVAAEGAVPPAVALTRGFEAANAALLAENRPLAGCRWERRVFVGATAVVVAGRTLTIAQVPATQALVVQDRRLYAFPDLASWCCDYVPPTDQPEPDPLGCRVGTRPLLFHTVAAPGDLVLVCSAAVARHLARDAAAGLAPDPETLLRGNLDAILDRLGEVVVAHELDDAFAAGVVVDRLPAARGGRDGLREGLDRLGAAWAGAGRRSAPAAAPVAARVAAAPAPHREGRGAGRWAGVGVPLDRPAPADVAIAHRPAAEPSIVVAAPLGPGVRLGRAMAALAERLAPRRRPVAPPAARRQTLAAPGAGSVNRYTTQTPLPVEWRSNLPRGPEVHVPGRLMAVAFLLFVAFGGSSLAFDRQRDQEARRDAALAEVDAQLRAVSGPTGVAAFLRAEGALAEAGAAGAPVQALAAGRRSIDAAQERALGAGRLSGASRLGALPAAIAGRQVRLVRAGADLFLVADALYRLDADGRRLVRLLAPGAAVDGLSVGPLLDAAADGDELVVTDGAALFTRDASGRWSARPLAVDAAERWPGVRAAAYAGAFYALAADGRVLKYGADKPGAPPETWTDAAAHPELAAARDLAIDGRIHVLLADGSVLTFFRGALEGRRAPALSPPLADPLCLAGGDAGALYVVDRGADLGAARGRLVRLDEAGNAWQILPPGPGPDPADPAAAARALAAARDLVVDEAAGVVYFVTDRELWRANLPPLPSAAAL